MDRRLWLGMALVMGLVTPSAWPEAATAKPGVPRTTRNEPTFTSGWVNGEPTLRAEARGVKFFKRVSRERVSILVEVPGDRIEVEADTRGTVRVGRNGKFLRLQMQDPFEANVARIQKLTAGSAALDGLESFAASLEGQDRQEARSVLTSHALLHALRGSTGPSRSMARAVTPVASSGVVRAMATTREEGPYACWAEFATTMNQYLVEFNSCTEDYWWIPGWNAACAFQFSLQGELAFFWLIGCSGGMPV